MKRILIMLGLLAVVGCTKKQPNRPESVVQPFANEQIALSPETYDDRLIEPDSQGVYHLLNGRLLLKQIETPQVEGQALVNATLNLSADKPARSMTGTLFMIANDSDFNFINVLEGFTDLPTSSQAVLEAMGFKPSDKQAPRIELYRFITPYSAELFETSDKKLTQRWCSGIIWQQDATNLLTDVRNSTGFWVGVWLDSQSSDAISVDLTLRFTASNGRTANPNTLFVNPLMSIPSPTTADTVTLWLNLPQGIRNPRLYCFFPDSLKMPTVWLDSTQITTIQPLTAECSVMKDFTAAEALAFTERDAAMMLDSIDVKRYPMPVQSCRSTPALLPLPLLSGGKHRLTFFVQPAVGTVSALLVWEY